MQALLAFSFTARDCLVSDGRCRSPGITCGTNTAILSGAADRSTTILRHADSIRRFGRRLVQFVRIFGFDDGKLAEIEGEVGVRVKMAGFTDCTADVVDEICGRK